MDPIKSEKEQLRTERPRDEETLREETFYEEEVPTERATVYERENAPAAARTFPDSGEVMRERTSDRAPIEEGAPVSRVGDATHAPLFPGEESERFRSLWKEIQTGFVDEPRRAVEQADDLVKEVTDRLSAVFTRSRDELERQWTAGDEVSTEDLRQALQRYRSFFERLLSV